MTDDGAKQNPTGPLPTYSFKVSWGTMADIPFQEVTGLETETQVIDYRHSNSPKFSTVKMPGLVKFGNVTLKRGVLVADSSLWAWLNSIKLNTVKRETVVVRLLDEGGNTVMSWTLRNAWPTKFSAPTAHADGGEIVVQTIELAHEGLTITNG